jgi:hypothetical protein
VTQIKYARNPQLTDRWARAIGKVVLNFGLLELESHLWLLHMPDEPLVFPELWFAERVSRIQVLIHQHSFGEIWRASASKSWEKAQELAKFRNRVVHSPLMFGRTNSKEEGEPDWVGVVDVRLLGQGRKQAESQHSLADIVQSTDAIASLVEELSELRDAWCSARDKALLGRH